MIELIDGKLTQWDTGRYVRVTPNEGESIIEVHVYGESDTTALNVETELENDKILAPIPNVLLQSNQKIFVCVVKVSEDSRQTVEITSFHVWARAKPDDYVYTETEVKSYEALKKELTDLINSASGSDIFIAEYNKTSYTEIKTAYDEGKVVCCKYGDAISHLCTANDTYFDFVYHKTNTVVVRLCRNVKGGWSFEETEIAPKEFVENQITAFKNDGLSKAIDDKLAAAKANGDFKGEKGDKGDSYTLTDTDKQTIATMAVQLFPVYEGEVSEE